MPLRRRSRLAALTSLVLVLGLAPAPHALADIAVDTTVDLAMLRDTLVTLAPAGSSAVIDPPTGLVLLNLAGEPSAQLKASLAQYANLVRTKRTAPIEPTLALYGGLGISSEDGGQQCTAGFIATRPGVASWVITAGHCVRTDQFWERKQTYLGERESDYVYGETGDFGLIRIKGVKMTPKGWINTPSGPISVTDYRGEFWIGQYLCFMGNVSKLQCGTVLHYGQTASYGDGIGRPPIIVKGLVEMTLCARHGDSGGPLFADDGVNIFGMGIASGAKTDLPCTDPEYRSYFQPLQEILEYYNDLPLRTGEPVTG